MTPGTEQRKLAAIMFTDMVGYSALAQRDEALALELLEEHRRIVRALLPAHSGREVKTTGDGFLIEFPSALAAVQGASAIQQALHERNQASPPERPIRIRIGIHVGDVVVSEGDIHGDGVNIAARLEPLAEAGGICVSEDVARQVRNKLAHPVVALGPAELKNIELPVVVHRVVLPWQEARSEGKRLKTEGGMAPSAAARSWRTVGLVVLAIVAAVGIAVWRMQHGTAGPTAGQTAGRITSLAVKPLDDFSGDTNNAWLSDGMTEALCNALGNISALRRVPPRTSVMRYKGAQRSLRQMAQDLEVEAIVEGSVQRAGNQLRVTAKLIEAATDRQLWGNTFNRDFSEFFVLQDEVARAIATEIQVRLTPEDQARLARGRAVKSEAIEAYWRGMQEWWKWSDEGMTNALYYFQKAIKSEPDYARAHAGLALTYIYGSAYYPIWRPREGMPKGREAAERAIQLDPSLAEAYVAMGDVRMLYDWDWVGAGKDFRQALQLNSRSSLALDGYGNFLAFQRRFDEAVAVWTNAMECDLLSPALHFELGWAFFMSRQYDGAVPHFNKALDLDREFLGAHLFLGSAYLLSGKTNRALAQFQNAKPIAPQDPWVLGMSGWAYGIAGYRHEAAQVLADLDQLSRKRYVLPFLQAYVCTGLGQKETALAWLEQACEDRDANMTTLNVDPVFDPLRNEPGFQALLKKVNLAPATGTNAPTTAPPQSVAVLPFVNISSDKENEYLSDGITEEVLNSLARIKPLRVPARTSCFVFKGKTEDIRTIGEKLNVATVLEGSVRKAGNQLRIHAELINVADGFQLWSDTYERDMTNIFAIQSDIAARVAEALKVQLLAQAQEPTKNIEAYNLYLLGRHHLAKVSHEGLTNALDCFQRAIEKDPNYARAYAGLADTYSGMCSWELAPKTATALARQAALKAIALDSALAEAHYVLGWVKAYLEWDFPGAEVEFRRAVELGPDVALAHDAYASFLNTQARFTESVLEQRRAIELDPLSTLMNVDLAWCLWHKRDFDGVIEQTLKTLKLDPNYAEAHRPLAWAYLWTGRTNEAIMALEKARSLNDVPWVAGQLGYPYAITGQRAKVDAILQELKAAEPERYVCPSAYLFSYVGLGDKENAFLWLRKCLEERDMFCPMLNVDPFFDSLRGDPRFTELLKEVGLVK